MKLHTLVAISLLIPATLYAQRGHRMADPRSGLNKAQRTALDNQAQSFLKASAPATSKAAQSTVAIFLKDRRVAFGTALPNQGGILTKWSMVSSSPSALVVQTPDQKTHTAKVTGIYPEYDLAVIQFTDKSVTIPPIDFTTSRAPQLGSFIALARPDGNVEGFGVVSVKHRSLRDGDRAYLGVQMDFAGAGENGVPIRRVMQDSSASRAGLQDGDIITRVNQRPMTDAMEMRNLLQTLRPGSEITVAYRRGTADRETTILLGSRKEIAEERRRFPRARLEKMQRMGTTPNRVRDNFPSVIQSDMAIEANDMGAPVTDLDGNFLGITIARASRIKTYIIPAAAIAKAISTKPKAVATIPQRETSRPAPNTTARNPSRRGVNNELLNEVERLHREIERNNRENEENLRKIREALRNSQNP